MPGDGTAVRHVFRLQRQGCGDLHVVVAKRRDGRADPQDALQAPAADISGLDEKDEENIWTYYNVIRSVEETFKTLTSDLDIRPVYHKTDDATKAHLNRAVLAYWVVSTTKYRLRQSGINLRWEEL